MSDPILIVEGPATVHKPVTRADLDRLVEWVPTAPAEMLVLFNCRDGSCRRPTFDELQDYYRRALALREKP